MKRALTVSYQDLLKNYYENPSDAYELEYPEFRDFKQYLSIKEVHSLGFNKDKLQKAVEGKKQLDQVFRAIHKSGFISRNDLKVALKNEFQKRGMDISPKASLIEQCTIYDAVKATAYINGKKTSGYTLGNIKFKFAL